MLLFERAVNITLCAHSSLNLYSRQFICNSAWTAVIWHWCGYNTVAVWLDSDDTDDANDDDDDDDDDIGIFIDKTLTGIW